MVLPCRFCARDRDWAKRVVGGGKHTHILLFLGKKEYWVIDMQGKVLFHVLCTLRNEVEHVEFEEEGHTLNKVEATVASLHGGEVELCD